MVLNVLGNFSLAKKFKGMGYKFVTGIGSEKTFINKSSNINSYGLNENDFVNVISKNSIIETENKLLKSGCLIFDNVFIGYEVCIGYLSLINTKAFIGHETKLGDLHHRS